MKKSAFVLSLDFELVWGLFDHIDLSNRTAYFDATLDVIPKLLTLFEKNKIHVTWATVGMLFNENWDEWYANRPILMPTYDHSDLNPYLFGEQHRKRGLDRFFFAPELIRAIQNTKGQEIGTHTYSHYYCLEQGQTKEQFEADLQQAVLMADKFKISLRSLVFPRNQFNQDYLEVCEKHQIMTVRTNPNTWYWDTTRRDTLFTKLVRTSDAYLPLGKKSYTADAVQPSGVVQQPSSRFFRPQHSQSLLNAARVHRIKHELLLAAKNGEAYHLWWHPHNFGVDTEGALDALGQILEVYKQCQQMYGMESLSMQEFAHPFHYQK